MRYPRYGKIPYKSFKKVEFLFVGFIHLGTDFVLQSKLKHPQKKENAQENVGVFVQKLSTSLSILVKMAYLMAIVDFKTLSVYCIRRKCKKLFFQNFPNV